MLSGNSSSKVNVSVKWDGAPAIVAGVVTLGVMQQIIRAFGRVEGSMQYILKAWPTIIELASVYKRLREFESKINTNIKETKSEISTEK